MNTLRRLYRSARRRLIRASRQPRVNHVQFGDLLRVTPISRDWGFDRGTPIDRFFIERFLDANSSDIRGRVLEVSNNDYTIRYGGNRVTRSDILHPNDDNPRATVIADLAEPDPELNKQFDCIICTQTLQLIFETGNAITQLHDWLRPGGVLLATVPGISQISRMDMELSGDYWRFTSAAVHKMFAAEFGDDSVDVNTIGNVLTAIAFLHGIAAEEIDDASLLEHDPEFQLLMTIRAARQG